MNITYEYRETPHHHRMYLLAMRLKCALIARDGNCMRIECTPAQHERIEHVRQGGRDELIDGSAREREVRS